MKKYLVEEQSGLKNKFMCVCNSEEIEFNILKRENGATTYEASGSFRYVELVYIVCSGIINGRMLFLCVEG